jgi:eukaryotic-like serine/threonine-protein kinase
VTDAETFPEIVGRYRLVRRIGRGAMGVVYEASDDQLGRPVALKFLVEQGDPQMRDRFLREARTAATTSHPHICQVFEIGEVEGRPYLTMELLDGRSLAERLAEGPLPAGEAVTIALEVLSALEALHRRGIVHRDLKPSNIFLTGHGVKLLDFGLARPVTLDVDATSLTLPGLLLGTPRYMSPEQARGEDVDTRSDLFSVGSVLFEMLAGRPAFPGESAIDALHAVLHAQPPALVGSLAVVDADRVIQRALAKDPRHRYGTAEEMAGDLRVCVTRGGALGGVVVRAATRLIVLPFKLLRPDPAVDFLAYSLPDAITTALSGIDTLAVRSSHTAARYATDPLDLRGLASEAAVDAVVCGTLLPMGGLLRVNLQLLDAPAGTVLWSHSAQVPVDELFQIEESVCLAVVEALSLPLSSQEQRALHRDVPRNPEAYAHYLRANRLSVVASQWGTAREYYRRAVEADPGYAPAWARLGRCLRVMSKYGAGPDAAQHLTDAEAAFTRAFELNPDLSLAHHLYTHLEVDSGRALQAVLRLLDRARARTGDPDLYAGLVHACRYVGLLDASVAAYHRAMRLDPTMVTTVAHTWFLRGEWQRAVDCDVDDPPYLTVLALHELGRDAEALALCRASRRDDLPAENLAFVMVAMSGLVGASQEEAQAGLSKLWQFPVFSDPEGWYYWALAAAGGGDADRALELLDRAVDRGLCAVRAFETPSVFDSVRVDPRFAAIVDKARASQAAAARAFADADGHRLLGLPSP